MTNFYQQIDDELKNEMAREDFFTNLNQQTIKELIEIQPFFEKFLTPLKKPLKTTYEGKIVINLDYIRIPGKTFIDHFSKEKTLILSRSKSPEHFGIPNEYIGNFKSDTSVASKELVNRASSIFKEQKNHPAFGNSFFIKTFIQRIPLIVDALETAFNLYDKIPIVTVLVGTTEDVISRSLAVTGAMKGIPTVCLQHGILMGEEAFIPVFTSHVAVYGEYEKRWYIARGLTEERIETIGHPRYDEIFTSSRISKSTFQKEHSLDPNKNTLLIATGPNLDQLKFKTMISELAKNGEFQLLIKPHPVELAKKRISMYEEVEKKYRSVHVITNRKANTHDLIYHSDAVIASLSTVALESLLFNKPVFVFYFLQSNREYDYYNGLGKYIQRDPINFSKIVALYFNSPQEKNFYNAVRSEFLMDSYKTEQSGRALSNLIYQLTKVRTI